MRKKIVAGNWKMNMDLAEGLRFTGSVDKYFKENPSGKTIVILCTPFIHLSGVHEILKHGKVSLGAQNCSSEASGAYTGEVSAWMIKSTGAEYVIIGHSERRSYYHEDDKLLNKKTLLAINSGLKVIFCCGEVLNGERQRSIFL
jgi:triosephosphate isomerase